MKILILLSLCGLSLAHLDYDEKPKMAQSCNCGWTNQKEGENKYPWIAGIMKKEGMVHIGGGTIITQWHVLSTVGLTGALDWDTMVVCLGAYDESFCNSVQKPNVYGVSKIHSYFQYNYWKQKNDLSVVLLDRKIFFDRTKGPACFPIVKITSFVYKTNMKMTGYGTEPNNGLMDYDLQGATMKNCKERHKHLDIKRKSQFCTFSFNKITTDKDFGTSVVWLDPEMERYTIIGMLSYGPVKLQDAHNPDVNTNVAHFTPWITKKVESKIGANFCIKDIITYKK